MIVFILFIIGICVGSFLNVVIDRIPHGQSIIKGRSHCDFCKTQLAWYDLIPLFSYLFLGGKCRYCKKHLSLQYPLIELLIGLVFVSLFLLEMPLGFMSLVIFIIDIAMLCTGIALTLIDIKYHLLPDVLLLFLLSFAVIRIFLTNPHDIVHNFFVALLATLPLLLIFLMTKGRGMGFGDVKLIFIIGFFLGFPGIIVAYYVAFLTGAAVGLILVLGRKKKFSGAIIAFGPFLLLGMLIATGWGTFLWNTAKTLLGI